MRFAPLDPSTLLHTLVILVVVGAATLLRSQNELDTATVATVYGAALGFAPRLSRSAPVNGCSSSLPPEFPAGTSSTDPPCWRAPNAFASALA